MQNNSNIHIASRDEIPAISSIYKHTFPEKTGSMLGQKTCEGYFSAMMDSGFYKILAADYNGEVVGFSIIQIDRTQSIDNDLGWMLSSPLEILVFMFKNPVYLLKRGVNVLKVLSKDNNHKSNNTGTIIDISNSIYLALIAVSEKVRGLGIGKDLLQKSIEISVETGKKFLDLDVINDNIHAQKIYEKSGFKRIGFIESRQAYIYRLELDL